MCRKYLKMNLCDTMFVETFNNNFMIDAVFDGF